MQAGSKYKTLTESYDAPVSELITQVSISPIRMVNDKPFIVSALWDTGAEVTCIDSALAGRLNLRLYEDTGDTYLSGLGGDVEAKLTFVDLFLTPSLKIASCPVQVANLPDNSDLIIGMDIIGMGDFAVCNADSKTSFSFVIPAFPDRIDFAEKAKAVNRE